MSGPEDKSTQSEWPERIADLSRRLAESEDQHRNAATALAGALHQAHQAGMTWSQIAESAGLPSADTARIRAARGAAQDQLTPALRWRVLHRSEPRPTQPALGLSITDAAKHLGVTRATVYAWIKKGKLRTTTDEAGLPRVLIEDRDGPA